MIKTVKEAYKIAKKIEGFKKPKPSYCREDDVSFFFTYSIPGLPMLRIYKENGKYEKIPFHVAIRMEIKNEREIPLSELK